MNSYIYAILTLFLWGFADLFYKKGNDDNDKYSHYKTGMFVGIVMGIHAIIFMIVKKINIFDCYLDILKYLPVSLCYIISMIIGYKGLKYIDLSISSPIQNTSGIITSILLCIIFKILPSKLEIIGLITMFIGVLALSIIEYKKDNKVLLRQIKISAIIFPILYCLIDGMGTFLDSIYLDQLELINEDIALIGYELVFFIYGIISFIILNRKKEKIVLKKEYNKLFASVFETFGQFTYVYAIVSHSEITVPIVSCYAAYSCLLSRLFLKEKLSILQYFSLLFIFIGIVILSFFE